MRDSQARQYWNQFRNQFDLEKGVLGTASATVGRFVLLPVEGASWALQIGAAKTFKEAISLNFKSSIRQTYRGGGHLAMSAFYSSAAYYGLGVGLMSAHKDKGILEQAVFAGLFTVLPEQFSVVQAAKTVRSRFDLMSTPISRVGWARINAGFFLRHSWGNPGTFAAIKTTEKVAEKCVPEQFYPVTSFFSGAFGVFATHRLGYAFLVAWSVQLMVSPEQSFKSAWKKASAENYIKAGDIRAAGRMGTAAVVFCILKMYEMHFKNRSEHIDLKTTSNASQSGMSPTNLFNDTSKKMNLGSEENFEEPVKSCKNLN